MHKIVEKPVDNFVDNDEDNFVDKNVDNVYLKRKRGQGAVGSATNDVPDGLRRRALRKR